jgi:hypothetical protein
MGRDLELWVGVCVALGLTMAVSGAYPGALPPDADPAAWGLMAVAGTALAAFAAVLGIAAAFAARRRGRTFATAGGVGGDAAELAPRAARRSCRFAALLGAVCEPPVAWSRKGIGSTYACRVADPQGPSRHGAAAAEVVVPTDDWPFLYLPERLVPRAYLMAVALLALASIAVLKVGGLDPGASAPCTATCSSSAPGSC